MQDLPSSGDDPVTEAPVPRGQHLFDNTWLLLVLSIVISGLIYNVWGLIETLNVPRLPIP